MLWKHLNPPAHSGETRSREIKKACPRRRGQTPAQCPAGRRCASSRALTRRAYREREREAQSPPHEDGDPKGRSTSRELTLSTGIRERRGPLEGLAARGCMRAVRLAAAIRSYAADSQTAHYLTVCVPLADDLFFPVQRSRASRVTARLARSARGR